MKFVVKNAVPAVTIAAKKRAFSLVEMLIVISILGIMAAIIIPAMKDHSQRAKEAAAKDNLRILRTAIEAYAARNNGVPPGYENNNTTATPNYLYVVSQLTMGDKYLPAIPQNPFNDKAMFLVLDNNETLDEAAFTANPAIMYGWIYHPATKAIKLHWHGTDSEGQNFFNY